MNTVHIAFTVHKDHVDCLTMVLAKVIQPLPLSYLDSPANIRGMVAHGIICTDYFAQPLIDAIMEIWRKSNHEDDTLIVEVTLVEKPSVHIYDALMVQVIENTRLLSQHNPSITHGEQTEGHNNALMELLNLLRGGNDDDEKDTKH